METVERDYADKGVKFYYIYKALAHPENNGYITPFNLKERLMHIAEAKRTLGSSIEWICDSMENELKHALGDRPNSEFVIDPDGKIIISRSWSDPAELREDLAKLVGEVDSPTTIDELNMRKLPPPQKAPTGVVKRIELPGTMSPLKITPVESRTPHYAKLRVESGNGKMYLGFFLDPLYKVHWNNKAAALNFTIEPPEGVSVSAESGRAPDVDVDADADPREFLIDVTGRSTDPLKVVVKYFACDDAETFCVPVTQTYLVSFDRDRDGGSRRSAGGRGRRGGGRGGANGQRPGTNPGNIFAQNDEDNDGKLSGKEIPEGMRRMLSRIDTDADGEISKAEFESMMSRRGGQRGGNRGRPQGPRIQR